MWPQLDRIGKTILLQSHTAKDWLIRKKLASRASHELPSSSRAKGFQQRSAALLPLHLLLVTQNKNMVLLVTMYDPAWHVQVAKLLSMICATPSCFQRLRASRWSFSAVLYSRMRMAHVQSVSGKKKTDNASIREPELGKARVIVITIAVKSSPRGPIRWYDFCNGLSACQGDTNQMHLYEHKCSELEWYSLICTLELTSWPSQQTQNLQIPKCHHLAANIQQVTSIHCKVQLLFMLYPTTPRWTLYIYICTSNLGSCMLRQQLIVPVFAILINAGQGTC